MTVLECRPVPFDRQLAQCSRKKSRDNGNYIISVKGTHVLAFNNVEKYGSTDAMTADPVLVFLSVDSAYLLIGEIYPEYFPIPGKQYLFLPECVQSVGIPSSAHPSPRRFTL